jgi:hypothetical protein
MKSNMKLLRSQSVVFEKDITDICPENQEDPEKCQLITQNKKLELK